MDYKFIENAKLRRLMQKARHKRKVLNNPNRIPEHKNAKITAAQKKLHRPLSVLSTYAMSPHRLSQS